MHPAGRAIASKFGRHNRPRRAPTRGGGCPQGAPLPIVCSRRFALGRAPTRGAPTVCLLAAFGPGKGAHKGRPYRLSSLGILPWGGHPQGAPLPIVFSRRLALGRAPTRGAPTDCLLAAYWPWGGHPQGAPLPIVFSRHFDPGEGAHKGCPYRLSSRGILRPGEGTHKGRPYRLFSRGFAPGEGTHKGCPYRLSSRGFDPGEGTTHKGCPYRLSSRGILRPWGGHPQGVPLPIVFSRRFALGRAPTRGAPTDCLLSAYCPEKGAHRHPKRGRPYPIQAASRGFSNLMQLPRPSRGARWTPGIR